MTERNSNNTFTSSDLVSQSHFFFNLVRHRRVHSVLSTLDLVWRLGLVEFRFYLPLLVDRIFSFTETNKNRAILNASSFSFSDVFAHCGYERKSFEWSRPI